MSFLKWGHMRCGNCNYYSKGLCKHVKHTAHRDPSFVCWDHHWEEKGFTKTLLKKLDGHPGILDGLKEYDLDDIVDIRLDEIGNARILFYNAEVHISSDGVAFKFYKYGR